MASRTGSCLSDDLPTGLIFYDPMQTISDQFVILVLRSELPSTSCVRSRRRQLETPRCGLSVSGGRRLLGRGSLRRGGFYSPFSVGKDFLPGGGTKPSVEALTPRPTDLSLSAAALRTAAGSCLCRGAHIPSYRAGSFSAPSVYLILPMFWRRACPLFPRGCTRY